MDLSALRRRRRLTPLALAAGLLGSAVLGLGTTGTFSGLLAQITNSPNTAGAGSIVMQETDASANAGNVCASTSDTNNSYICSTSTKTWANKYGGATNLTPGGTASTATVRIYSTGSLTPGGFTLAPGACSNSTNGGSNPLSTTGNICGQLKLTLTCQMFTGGSGGPILTVYSGATLTSISGSTKNLKTPNACQPPQGAVGGNNYTSFAFSVQLDSNAGADIQGQVAGQDLVWQFTQ